MCLPSAVEPVSSHLYAWKGKDFRDAFQPKLPMDQMAKRFGVFQLEEPVTVCWEN